MIDFILIALISISFSQSDFDSIFALSNDISLRQDHQSIIGSVRSCFVDGDSAIYICDSKMAEVKIYDTSGMLTNIVGAKGKGPGEFLAPFDLFQDGDTLYVIDPFLRRINLYHKKNFDFIRSYHVPDAREIEVANTHIYVAAPQMGTNTSLHIYNKTGRLLQGMLPLPEITVQNKLFSDGVSFDLDGEGNIYLIHEMEYKVHKLDPGGDIRAIIHGKSEKYKPPPQEPFQRFYSRQKAEEWTKSWSHMGKLIVLKHLKRIIVSWSNYDPDEYVLDIYDLDGKLLYGNISTDLRILCGDSNDDVYFLAQQERDETIEFRIKQFHLIGN